MSRRYWLFKTEPTSFSIQALARCRHQSTCWDGVRNYQARNMLRDVIGVGDEVFIYHSRTPPLAIVGTAKVTRAGYPDPSQFHPGDDHFDPRSPPDAPRWFAVDLRLQEVFSLPVTRSKLRKEPSLASLEVLRPGSRLSIQPVSAPHWRHICKLAKQLPPGDGA